MIRTLLTGLLLSACVAAVHANDDTNERGSGEKTAPQRVFELRTYYTNDGKLTDLHKRFRDHTCRLLKQHGAELIGFWTPLDEKDGKGGKLVYLVAFPSREAAQKTWADFQKDPEWQKVYKESHANGALVKKVESVYMEPTDYSEMK
jgi:NIPSNAP